jgi:uncharacterized protein YyaL (SSP411 family)
MNRLSQATSPYLLQHEHNPVGWWPWGPEAFAEARRLNRPVLLSVGYAACHWCHVMAHESFEDPAVAQVMNDLFVNIKVDREERPDVDHVYMSALHLLGEQGGWPLTMFLTPAGEPFWGGTYFPKEPKFGRPGFVQLLHEVARVFQAEPERIAHNQALLKKSLADEGQAREGGSLGLTDLDRIGAKLMELIDSENGGLPGAPKFPNPTVLEFLLRYALRTGDGNARQLFLLTMERMALGGIHDQIGGGFARYSVDERWHVPHFEKMLYDNAQLLELYAVAAHETGRALFRSAADGIVAWLDREMVTPDHAFASSLDADSEGEEGRFYVWSFDEIEEVLGSEDAALFTRVYDVSRDGNWEHKNVLNRLNSGEAPPAIEARLAQMSTRLLEHRSARVRPGLDDKVLADWNGLTIAALVRSGRLLDRPAWIETAARAYRFIVEAMSRDGRLGHSYRAGALVYPGFALDHAAMMRAALALYETTSGTAYLEDARRWRDVLMRDYLVPDSGRLAMTAKDADRLVVRPQPSHDDAVPNANGVFVEALVRLAQITGAEDDRQLADSALTTLVGIARPAPVGHTSILNALDLHLRGLTVVVTGADAESLHRAATRLSYIDGSVCAAFDAQGLGQNHPAKQAAVSGTGPRALVCSGMRCSLPVTTAHELLETVAALRAVPARPASHDVSTP